MIILIKKVYRWGVADKLAKNFIFWKAQEIDCLINKNSPLKTISANESNREMPVTIWVEGLYQGCLLKMWTQMYQMYKFCQ